MGGNALKNTETRRYLADEYKILETDVLSKCNKLFKSARIPLYFASKESFGDLDVLVLPHQDGCDIRDLITSEFKPNEIIKNSNCWSFDYCQFQIDLIIVSEDDLETSFNYYSYNDLGNLMGRLAHKFNTKYGHDGLRYVLRGNGKIIAELNLSKDIKTICEFLDLSYDKWKTGFSALDEIFEFISNSKYFNPNYYDLHELNSINRKRNEKRKTYQTFIDYCESLKNSGKSYYQHNPDKDFYLDYINSFFPNFIEWRNYHLNENELFEKSKTIFNGNIIMDKFPHLKNEKLGFTINNFHNNLGLKSKIEIRDYYLKYDTQTLLEQFSKINEDFI